MAEQFNPTIPTTPKPVQIAPRAYAVDSLVTAIGGIGAVASEKYRNVQRAKAESDFVDKQINNDELQTSSAYSRTVSKMGSEDWFTRINTEIADGLDDPSSPIANMDRQTFDEWLGTKIKDRKAALGSDKFAEYHLNDFADFLAQNMIKLKANYAKVRKVRNHEKLINSTTEAVSRYFKEPGRSQEDVTKYLNALPGVTQIDSKTWANIVASSAQVAASEGSDVGIKYIEANLLGAHPNILGTVNTAKNQYFKKIDKDEQSRIFQARAALDQQAQAGLFEREHAKAVLEDSGVMRSLGMNGLLGLLSTSRRASATSANVHDIADKLMTGQEIVSASANDMNKAHNMIWDQLLAENESTPTQAAIEYAAIAAKSKSIGKNFKGWFDRAIASTNIFHEGSTAPDSWFTALQIAEELKEGGSIEILDLDAKTALGLSVAMDTFNLAKDRTTTTPLPAEQAGSEAYRAYSLLMTKQANGTLPSELQNRREFDKSVDKVLKDAKDGPWFTDYALSESIVEELKSVAYTLGVKTGHIATKDLVDAAWSEVKGRYGKFGNTLFSEGPGLKLHTVLQVTPDKLDAVSDFLMDSEAVKNTFTESSPKDLRVEIVSTPKDALIIVQDPKNPSVTPPSIRASELGNKYREHLVDKQTLARMDAEKEMDNKRRYANLRKHGIIGEFSASLGPLGSRNEWLSDEFQSLFFNSDIDTQYKLAAAVINAESTPKNSRERVALSKTYEEIRNTNLMAFVKKQAGKIVSSGSPAAQMVTAANLLTYLGQDISQLPDLGSIEIAEAKEFANLVQKMPEGEVLVPEVIRAHVTDMHASIFAELYLKAHPEDFEIPKATLGFFEELFGKDHSAAFVWPGGMSGYFKSDPYKTALSYTLAEEGGYNPNDVGSQTFMGIRRVNNPDWDVWPVIDAIANDSVTYPTSKNVRDAINELQKEPTIRVSAAKKYKVAYWDWLNLDKATDQTLSTIMFDHAVNAGQPRAAVDARAALQDVGSKGIKLSSKHLTDKEIDLINSYGTTFKNAFIKRMMSHYNKEGLEPNAERKTRLMNGQSMGSPIEEYIMQLEAERAIRTDQPTTE